MATGEGDNNKKEGKGFAGLSSLMSDVDTTPPSAAGKESAGTASAAPSTGRPASQPAQPKPQPSQQQPYRAPSQPSSGSSTGKWILGIAAVIGVLWFIGEANKKPTSSATTSSPSTQTPTYTPPKPASPPVPASNVRAPSRPEEAKPPVGRELVFSTAQIRYCLAEDIRLDSAKSAVDNYSDADVDRFNVMVADYNNRCSSFRYRKGALESARRNIELYRSQLQTDGRSRFARLDIARPAESEGTDWSKFTPVDPPAAPRPTPDATVQAIQQKLNELGYNAGSADGLMGRGTRSAIIAFQQDKGLATAGVADRALLNQLQQASSRSATTVDQRPSSPVAVTPTVEPLQAPAGSKSTGDSIPQNASLNYLGNGWECNRGYYRGGDECRPVQIPLNASLNYLGNGWECNRGYYKAGNDCRPVQTPQNASLNYLGNGWECNRGHYRGDNECRPVQIPQNASLNYLGNGWECNRGYYKAGNDCRPVQPPQNASLNYLGNGWECSRGYYRRGNECPPVQLPQNASLNYLGNGWECNQGLRRVGSRCEPVN